VGLNVDPEVIRRIRLLYMPGIVVVVLHVWKVSFSCLTMLKGKEAFVVGNWKLVIEAVV
jgi:hypothetical protein